MHIIKRDGRYEEVNFNKIVNRISKLIDGSDLNLCKLDLDPMKIASQVIGKISNNMTTNQLDNYTAEICQFLIPEHYHYSLLADRLIVSGHHKNTRKYANFSKITEMLYRNRLVTEKYYNYVTKNANELDAMINHDNDYKILDYTGMKSLLNTYFLKSKNHHIIVKDAQDAQDVKDLEQDQNNDHLNEHYSDVIERYQHLLMRQCIEIFMSDSNDLKDLKNLKSIKECYDMMTEGYFTHASPTMFNAGTKNNQMSSCFLLGIDDSVESMYETMRNMAHISKSAGGIGLHISNIRASGSYIRGTNGHSSGIIPFIRTINECANHIDQGGRRKGSIAVYLEPWHADIINFIEAKMNTGAEETKARELFYGLWIPNIFMNRVIEAIKYKEEHGCESQNVPVMWSLMCPSECPKLLNCYGEEFESNYLMYESNKNYREQLPILLIWDAIIKSQIETGTPYMCYKDHVNNKSAQQNIGMINSSNLCTEIMEYSDHQEYGTCNLASINLKSMVKSLKDQRNEFDFKLLEKTAYQLCVNLNNIIDNNFYPVKESKRSNFRHRPIAIGVQGLCEAFIRLKLKFNSQEAIALNYEIFKVIYYGALKASMELSRERTNKFKQMLDFEASDASEASEASEDLKELKSLSSKIELYENIVNKHNISNLKYLSIAEQEFIQDTRNKLSKCLVDINVIINKYGLPKYTNEYGYMNIDNIDYIGSYSTFVGSPAHEGKLQYDMWSLQLKPDEYLYEEFNVLKEDIKKYGLRNSLLTTIMPTASSSLVFSNTECVEPLAHCIYVKNTIFGSEIIYNKELLRILHELKLWNPTMKDKILQRNGTITTIDEIPTNVRELFLTAFEVNNKSVLDLAISRSPFIDQSQSLNHYVNDVAKIASIHVYGYKNGLKTGSYYIRTRPKVDPIKFSLHTSNDSSSEKSSTSPPSNTQSTFCSRDNPNCQSCSA